MALHCAWFFEELEVDIEWFCVTVMGYDFPGLPFGHH